MNITTTFAIISSFVIFAVASILSFNDISALFDFKGFLIVIGGTVSTTLVCYPLAQVFRMFRIFFLQVIGYKKRDYHLLIKEIVTIAKASYRGPKAVEAILPEITDYFLKEGTEILIWTDSDVPKEKFRDLLETRAMTHYRNYTAEASTFKTVAKFPPAFGLMGTTIGMIALLQSLGDATEAKSTIGPAMAVALITTLYGLGLSNFIFVPIAENLNQQTEEDQAARMMVVEGLMLIREEMPATFIEEYVLSFLLPRQRPKEN